MALPRAYIVSDEQRNGRDEMKDYRVVMLSLEPIPDDDDRGWFVIYRKAFNKQDLIREVNQEYSGMFEVDEYALQEIGK